MSVQAWTPPGVTSFGAMPLVTICDTPWGYTIRCETTLSDRAALIERVSGVAGLTFLVLAAGHWLFPPVAASIEPLSQPVLASIALGLAGMLFVWISTRGLRHEVQVDLTAQRLNWAVCNHAGRSRVLESVPFERVGSAFIRRSKTPGVPAALCVRLADGMTPVELATGREATLRPLHEKLSADLNGHRTTGACWPVRPIRPGVPRRAQVA